jgi:hypothetical protein
MNPDAPRPAPGYETTDASPRVAAITAVGLVVIIGLCLAVAAWLYRHRSRSEDVESTLAPDGRFQNGPNEQTRIEQAWVKQDRLVHEHLDSYGWVDRPKGIVHIPIDRAIDLMLAAQKAPETRSGQGNGAP